MFKFHFKRALCAALVLASSVAAFKVFADGPGLGNLTYASNEQFATIATFTSANAAPRGHGLVVMHKGYLVVIFANDGGGGKGSGGFTFYNVSNPRSPVPTFTTLNTPPYSTSSSSNYAGDIREAHGFSFYDKYVCLPSNKTGDSGLQFWDWSNMDLPNPFKVSTLSLPGLTSGDYTATPWWVFWQGGRYAYVAGTSGGLYIVDASNPLAPVLVDRGPGKPNPIPTSQTGGFRLNTMFVIGNLLVTSASDASGLSTFDISDPANPVLLHTIFPGNGLYSIMVNGDRIYGAHDPARIWDISNPANITLIGSGPNIADKGGYGTVQDGVFHYGSSSSYVKLGVSSMPPTLLGTNAPSGFSNPDWDFATALGNLVFVGNDHSGSALVVHQTTPDTNGPLVNMVNPRNGATNQALTSRIGLTFTDQVDIRTVNTNTCIIRPVGGQALPGRYSVQTGIVNFWPDELLQPNTTYEVVVPAGGIQDYVSNTASITFTSRFSTITMDVPLTVNAAPAPPATNGQNVQFTASAAGLGAIQYSWNFGDGTPPTAFSTSSNISHAFAEPGHYQVIVTASNNFNQSSSASFVQTIYRPLTPSQPTASSTIIYDASTDRVWNVNADANTVAAIGAGTLTRLFEKPVGKNPRTLARASDGAIWVVNQDDASISVLDPSNGDLLQTIPLPRASRPYGIAFSPDGSSAYVTLQGTGRLLRLNALSRTVTGDISVGPTPRGVAVSGDSQRILVTRFISPDSGGEIAEVSAAAFSVIRTFTLAIDPGPDLEDSGRGLPNFLSTITISPDGWRAWIPSKKDNIQRGLYRDGLALDFESTVRTIVSQIDLNTNAEVLSARQDLNDRDMAFAAQFSPLGDYVFVAVQGANAVDVFDAYTAERVTALENTGRSPQGLAVSPDGQKLFVQNFMSRTVRVYDISGIVASTNNLAAALATISTVTNEPLPPQVLLGKQIFYNAEDNRMNRDSYISCASCHLDGGHDGRVWDFTDRGEGLRNTIALIGRAATGHGRVHWSANFDEIQDFEHDIRGPFGGDGFMSDADFNSGTRNQPLGDRKGGLSPELDALAAYVSSLTNVNASPFRNHDGSLTSDAVAGKSIFAALNCASCHTGNQFTDSSATILHDVGTIKPGSGQRLGQPLTGLDTPTLKGIWETAPYFHDGSAATLLDVFADTNGHHGSLTAGLNEVEKQQLVAYLQQIDESEIVNVPPEITLLSPTNGASFNPPANVMLSAVASDDDGIRRVEFFANGVWIGESASSPFTATWSNAAPGAHQITARATDNLGDFTISAPVAIVVDPAGLALRWSSTSSSAWDTNSFNWFNPVGGTNDLFRQADNVLFDDTAGVVTNITIASGMAVAPATMTVDSSANDFSFSGAGRISGAAEIVKKGGSRLTLGNANDFSGDITVLGGVLRVNHNRALGDSNGVTMVASGAALDLGAPGIGANALNITNEVIVVSGGGPDGLGAIVNNSGASQLNALHHILLAGDTTIGGLSRFDVRNTGGPASVQTDGQPRNLVKIGTNQVNFTGAAVDENLADIEVRAGLFGLQTLTGIGNPTNTLTVFSNATLRLTDSAGGVVLRKELVLRDGAILHNTSGNNNWGGTVELQGAGTFNVAGSSLTITNAITGVGSLVKIGNSPLTLSGLNTFGGGLTINAGTVLLAGDGSLANSELIHIASGATLNVSGRGDSTLTLGANQRLQGGGTVTGNVTVGEGAIVSPGTNTSSIAAFTVSGIVNLNGMTLMELNKSALTNDLIRGATTINYGGTLMLTNLSGTLAAGDSFKLFNAANYSGAFDQIVPSWAGPGLAWNTSGLNNGILSIVAAPQPVITGLAQTGNTFVLSGTNGPAHAEYYILASTNAALPLANWTVVATNWFDASGGFSFTNSADPNLPQQFYLLRQP